MQTITKPREQIFEGTKWLKMSQTPAIEAEVTIMFSNVTNRAVVLFHHTEGRGGEGWYLIEVMLLRTAEDVIAAPKLDLWLDTHVDALWYPTKESALEEFSDV